ncbi:hypothetical protein EHS25_005385 [Saitozyma podzolica]|uniref:Uncharacterized protein n=1 Tax=Saitozyma podzolica TaxID=1890683 RepID=A0A427XY57_9TREE|nr:hypothetical protein EHS25_005385 [Saitozyma podzolica]
MDRFLEDWNTQALSTHSELVQQSQGTNEWSWLASIFEFALERHLPVEIVRLAQKVIPKLLSLSMR